MNYVNERRMCQQSTVFLYFLNKHFQTLYHKHSLPSPLFCCQNMNIAPTPMVDSNINISWVLHLLHGRNNLMQVPCTCMRQLSGHLEEKGPLVKAAWQVKVTALILCLRWLGLSDYLPNQFQLCWRDQTSPQDQMAEAESYPWDTNEVHPRTWPARNGLYLL